MADRTINVTLKAIGDFNDVLSNVKQVQNALEKVKMPVKLSTDFKTIFSSIEQNSQKAMDAMSKGFKEKGDVKAFERAIDEVVKGYQKLYQLTDRSDFKGLDFSNSAQSIARFDSQIKQLENDLNQIRADRLKEVEDIVKNPPSGAEAWKNFFNNIGKGEEGTEKARKALEVLERQVANAKTRLEAQNKTLESSDKWKNYAEAVEKLRVIYEDLTGSSDKVKQKTEELNSVREDRAQIVAAAEQKNIEIYTKESNILEQATEKAREHGEELKRSAVAQLDLNKEMDQFKSRIGYFLGMNNAVRLLRQGLRETFETIKDLDAVMTETAVVTEFSVADMWSQLPEYTERANQLGVSIHDTYEAATLYYQQGLKTNQVMEVSNQTLKMARIASLDAAEATDRMTNALRGFNMEINEENATRVADVYSKLAAISASNVDEISTAMTKVASLASNANMEFETTAAFLSQIVETTRESAETAGTALKTVIARFSEVKKLYNTGELLGTTEEGEEIDVNKVSTALRTAGIDLNEYLTGMKGLDDIFLELAEKWDSLDQVQQRYIATMAAGSRQQSRFIAMMQDYGRTVELVDAANNAAGASQEQYEKTLDSLESKLNQLKNSWNTFLMDITNNAIIKGAVDMLRGLLDAINKLTGALPGFTSALGKGLVVLGAWAGARKIFSKFIATASESMATVGAQGAANFLRAFSGGLNNGKGGLIASTRGLFSNILNFGGFLSSGGLLKNFQSLYDNATFNPGDILDGQKLTNYDLYDSALIRLGKRLRWSADQQEIFTSALAEGKKPLEAASLASGGLTKSIGLLGGSIGGTIAIIGGVIAVIAVLVWWFNKLKHDSPEEVFKRTQATAKKMSEELSNIKNKTEEVNNALSNLGEHESTLETLAYGTQAWREEVDKVNQSVLDLINKYPDLAKFFEFKNGIWTQKEGAEGDINTYLQGQQRQAEQANQYAQYLQNQAEGNLNTRDRGRRVSNAFQSALEGGGINTETFVAMSMEEIRKLYNESGGFYDADQFRAFMKERGVEFGENEKAIQEYFAALMDSMKAPEEVDANILSMANKAALDAKVSKENVDAVADILAQQMNSIIDGAVANLDEKDFSSDEYADFWAKQLGIENKNDLDINTLTGEVRYKGSDNKWKEAENEQQIYAAATEDLTDNAKNIEKIIQSSPGLKALLDPETMSERDWGEGLLAAAEYGSSVIGEWIQGQLEEYKNIKARNDSILQSLGLSEVQGLNGEQQQIRGNLARRAVSAGGVAEATELVGALDEALNAEGVTEEFQEWLLKNLPTDISNPKEVKEWVTQMKAQASAAGVAADAIENLENKFIDFADKTERIDFSKVNENTTNASKLRADVLDRDSNDLVFSEEDAAILREAMPDAELQQTADGLVLVNHGLNEVAEALGLYITDQTTKGTTGLEESLARGADWEEYLKTHQGFDINNLGTGGSNSNSAEAEELRNVLTEAGYDPTTYAGMFGEELVAKVKSLFNQDYGEGGTAYVKNQETDLSQSRFNNYRYGNVSDDQRLSDAMNPDVAGSKEAAAALIDEAKAYEECTDEINEYTKALKRGESGAKELAAIDLARQIAEWTKKINTLKENTEDSLEALTKFTKGTSEYNDAIDDITNNINKIFGYDLNSKFLTDEGGLESFKKALNGSRDDWEAFLQGADAAEVKTDEFITKFSIDADQAANIANQLDNLEFDIEGTADMSGVIRAMLEAGMTVEEVGQALNDLGYAKVDFDVKYQDIWVPTGTMSVINTAGQKTYGFRDLEKKRVPIPATVTAHYNKRGLNAFNRSNAGSGGKSGGTGGGGGGGGGGSDKNDTWKNPYDELYNLTEKINEALRDREKLEREYDRMINHRVATGKKLQENSLAELKNLKEEIALQKEYARRRLNQINNIGSKTYQDEEGNDKTFEEWGVTKYASYNSKTGLIEIDWDGIDAITDTELGGAVEAYISQLEEWVSDYEETEETLEGMNDAVWEIEHRGIEDAIELQRTVYDLLVEEREKQIEALEEVNDSINDSNSRMVDAIRESIDLERQIRDNTKTEEDIADKEARLAYLQRDTSGANDLDILKLQQEIDDARQNYTDTLIDQAIDRMATDNEKAARQREDQIAIMEEQLRNYQESGEIWKDVDDIIREGMTSDGVLAAGSRLEKLFEGSDDFKSSSWLEKREKLADFSTLIAKAFEGFGNANRMVAESTGEFTLANGTKLTFNKKTGNWEDENGTSYTNIDWGNKTATPVFKEISGSTVAKETADSKKSKEANTYGANDSSNSEKSSSARGSIKSITDDLYKGVKGRKDQIKALQQGINDLIADGYITGIKALEVDGLFGNATKEAVKKLQSLIGTSADGSWGPKSRNAFKASKYSQYKTGGLANYTGMAWLDGTPSKPELVLNAKDTQNFLALKDILSDLSQNSTLLGAGGDNYYNIEISVDEISNDYDVDRLAERVKKQITDDATYRNVNAIRYIR